MRLAFAAVSYEDHWSGAFDIASLGQFMDFCGTDLRCRGEVELIQSPGSWQVCFLDASCDGVALAHFQLNGKQCLQVSRIGLSLLDSLFRQWSALLGDGWQSQNAALLFDCSLLQVFESSLDAGQRPRLLTKHVKIVFKIEDLLQCKRDFLAAWTKRGLMCW